MNSYLWAACLIFLLMSGSLGLKTIDQCDNDPAITRDSELMQCYRAAAITMAYAGIMDGPGGATDICNRIWSQFGAPRPDDDDMKRRAEISSNACFDSIAKVSGEPDLCYNIQKKGSLGTALAGSTVTQELCLDEVERLEKIKPQYYYSKPDNICALVFILPLLVFASLRFR